jgi:hypothetical protein
VSHPIPLHPDADLALVLDELRQSVAAWGDEGLVMRVLRARICLALLSILDTLIDLLADFRAGRLPPVLPADEARAPPSRCATDASSSMLPVRMPSASSTPRSRRMVDDTVDESSAIAARPETASPRTAAPCHAIAPSDPAFARAQPPPSPRAPIHRPAPPRWRIQGQDCPVYSCLFHYDIVTMGRTGKRRVAHHLPATAP